MIFLIVFNLVCFWITLLSCIVGMALISGIVGIDNQISW